MEAANKIKERVTKMKPIQEYLLDFIDQDENQDANFSKLTNYFNEQNLIQDKREFTIFLHVLSEISSNYHRYPDFFEKIERILTFYQEDIKKFFTNIEIFNFFIDSKRILLLLFEKEMLKPDKSLVNIITSNKYKQYDYPQYFYPEFNTLLNDSFKSNDPEFEQKRKTGENDQQICKIIRDDDIDAFKSQEIPLTSYIEHSIYETNSILLKKEKTTLIEYSAFFGSLKIFNYLKSKQVELMPSLWLYATHGQNIDLIKILKEEKIQFNKKYGNCIFSNDFCRMLSKNQDSGLNDFIKQILMEYEDIYRFTKYIRYYNYAKMDELIANESNILENIMNDDHKEFKLFYALCKYDYIVIVDFFYENLREKIISLIIQKVMFLTKFEIIFSDTVSNIVY